MVDAVLLEWDGVLADTRIARQRAILEGLAEEGVSLSASTCDECGRGRTVHAAVTVALRQAFLFDETLADLVALRAERAFLTRLSSGGVVLTPGAAAFVSVAQERSRVAIVTRASRAETDLLLQLSGLDVAISAVSCADDVRDDAPFAGLYRHAMMRLTRLRVVERARTIAIADALPAFRAAREAALRVLAIGAPAHEALLADGTADTLAGMTMAELERLTMAPRQERSA